MGIKTLLNLRSQNSSSPYLFEHETCDVIGLQLVNRNLCAHALADADILLDLLDKIETIERPFVMHCKSGADRAGFASALYLMHMDHAPVALAKKQLSIRFFHVKSFQTSILDYVLDAYELEQVTDPMPIRTWIGTRYNKLKLTAEYSALRGTS